MRRLYRNGYVVAMDDADAEHDGGWILVEDGLVAAVGAGEPPAADETEDLGGALVAPGLVNTHHHLYQTLTRARAQQADLFTWLREQGVAIEAPFMTLSFLALSVIPALKITDRGLVDVERFALVPLAL